MDEYYLAKEAPSEGRFMADNISQQRRSTNMAAIKGKNTKPELFVRKLLHAHGFRFRLHRKDLPGRPDIVLPRYQTVIFVNGCFWHQHHNCKFARTPQTNWSFWQEKLAKTICRDQVNVGKLLNLGWNVIIVWECELRSPSFRAKELFDRITAKHNDAPR